MSNEIQSKGSGSGVGELARECLTSKNPAKWVAGIAIGTIAVAGLAITAISKLNNGQ